MRTNIQHFIEHRWVQRSIILLIAINAVILGMETSASIMAHYGDLLNYLDLFILKLFVVEIALRIYVYRLAFFKQPWSVFDFVIVSIALLPASEAFSTLRALRILRVLRLLSVIPAMRKVVEGLLHSIPGIASVAGIMVLFFYIFAVIATHLYGQDFPQWFGSLGSTMYTLFQIMTLEAWSMEIVRPMMEIYPSAWLFFVIYILITTFTMLNLFIAIIVNAMHSSADESAAENRATLKKQLSKEIKQMEARILEEIRNRK